MLPLKSITDELDRKIQSCLSGRKQTHFWYASFAGANANHIGQLYEMGFDNYPLAPVEDPHRILFFEKLFGCDICVKDKSAPSFFNTWPVPKIRCRSDLVCLKPDLNDNVVCQEYLNAVSCYLDFTTGENQLPVAARAFYPLDLACNLCGAENLFAWMLEAEEDVLQFFDRMADLYLAVRERLLGFGARLVNALGFPCVTCSDLQLPCLSADMIRRFVLPCYEKVARACGGAFIGLDCCDIGLLEEVMGFDWLVGCSFDRRLPLAEIRRTIGKKIFVLPYYAYDDGFDRPTLKDGIYWNPIVQCHSRNAEDVYREMAQQCNMVIIIERPGLQDVVAVRKRMLAGS